MLSIYECLCCIKGPYQSIGLHAQLSPATVKVQLIGLLSLSQCTSRWEYALFIWLLLDLLPLGQASYKQVNKHLAESMSNSENMDNFTALYTSYLCFTFGTIRCTLLLVLMEFLFFDQINADVLFRRVNYL